MIYHKTKDGLSLSEILSATKRQTEPDSGFPYTKTMCRCCNCLYCKKGKCVLQSCCCMPERIQSHACSFAEVMNACFENIRDSVFRFRLRLASERAAELQSCFLEREQKKRFYEGLNRSRRKDNSFTAQTFLLSCSQDLWERAKDVLCTGGYAYDCMDLKNIHPNDYTLFCAAMDIQYGGHHCNIEDLSNDEVVDFDVFRAICYAVCIHVYGLDVIVIANRRKRTRKSKKPEVKYERD